MGRPKKKKYENELKDRYGDKIKNLEPYINLNTKIKHICLVHNYEYYSSPSSVLNSKTGCPKCGEELLKNNIKEKSLFTNEEYKKLLFKKFNGNIVCLEEVTNASKSVLHKCLTHDYVYTSSPQSVLKSNFGCRHCGATSVKTQMQLSSDEIITRSIEYSNGKYIACDDYSGFKNIMHFKHILDNGDCHIFEMTPSGFFRGGKCYCENKHINKVIIGVNDISSKAPELVKYLHNKDDKTKYTFSSREKVYWDCPNCGNLLYKSISDVYYKGLSCHFCSDGISYPNKLMFNILNGVKEQIDVLKKEYSPSWCKFKMSDGTERNGSYDIYFEIKNNKYIVEMDGGFHYKTRNKSKFSLEYIQEIDKKKDLLAIEHNIKIIRIDCNYENSNRFNYILNNILKSELSKIIDFSLIDFNKCNITSLNSFIINSINLWNKGYTIKEIIEELYIGETTLREYLKQGTEAGLCSYSKQESIKRSLCKPVYCIELNKLYDSITIAAKENNLKRKNIMMNCNNRIEYCVGNDNKKLHWKYVNRKEVVL